LRDEETVGLKDPALTCKDSFIYPQFFANPI
jgi:hypothetical protein